MESRNIIIGIGNVLVAMFSASVVWLSKSGSKRRKLRGLIIEAAGAAVTAFVVFCLYMRGNLDLYLAFIISTLLGGAGIKGIEKVRGLIKKQTGIDLTLDEKDEKKEG
jgi:hypothetical protein